MKLTEHFSESEFFTATSGAPTPVQVENARVLCETVLEPVRVKIGVPIRINSGMRSPAHNRAISGAKRSEHMYLGDSAAADVDTGSDAWNRLLFDALLARKEFIGQLIAYVTKDGVVEWIHVSKKSKAKPTPEIMCATAEGGATIYRPYAGKIVRP